MKRNLKIIYLLAKDNDKELRYDLERLFRALKGRGHEVDLVSEFPSVLFETALESKDIDILHIHSVPDHPINAWIKQWESDRIAIIHTIYDDVIHTCFPQLQKQHQESLGLTAWDILLTERQINLKKFHPDHDPRSIRAEFGIGATVPVVGMVARFQECRRHDLLIQSIAVLKEKLPMIRLLLVGQGEHQEDLETLVRKLDLGHNVIFTGYRDQDLPQVYAAMNVMVLLASGSDGSCRAALEAMACGIPVVAFPVGTLPETIVDGVTGHLVSDGNLDQLTQTLSALLSDRNTMIRMSQSARKHMEDHFQEKLLVEKTELIYDLLMRK